MSYRAVNNSVPHSASPVGENAESVRRGIDLQNKETKPSLFPFFIQPKLTVGSPDDPYEKEADAMADRVMRMSEPSFIQRKCKGCEREEKDLQRKPLRLGVTPFLQAKNGRTVSDGVAHVIQSSKGGGSALDRETNLFMSSRFGHDFSGVKVHTDNQSTQLNRNLKAKAFTVGDDVYFNEGQYQPGTFEGKKLLAHELTHTIQQKGGEPSIQKAEKTKAQEKIIWINIGFDSSAVANQTTMKKLRASISKLKASIASCCSAKSKACDIKIKTNYDWVRYNKPAPEDKDYDSDLAKDNKLRDKNLDRIDASNTGLKILVTESTLSQTWEGKRIFPRANTGDRGVLWNPKLAADDTIAHEAGHAAGYTGDSEGGSHHSDKTNLMSPGNIRLDTALPDDNWCEQMGKTAV